LGLFGILQTNVNEELGAVLFHKLHSGVLQPVTAVQLNQFLKSKPIWLHRYLEIQNMGKYPWKQAHHCFFLQNMPSLF
jgi:hypothetical protein